MDTTEFAKAGYTVTDLSKPNVLDEDVRGEWWRATPERMHHHVFAVVRQIDQAQASRRAEALRHARLYSNRNMTGFGPGQWMKTTSTPGNAAKLSLNVIRSCIDTVAAKIAKNKPRAMFLTSGGDYELQERAKNCTKYLDGLFETSGMYQIGQRCFVDSEVYGTAAVKVFEEGDEIRVERVLFDELLVDDEDGREGTPSQIFHRKTALRSKVMATYGKDARTREAIRAATPVQVDPGARSVVDRIEIVECWYRGEDGRRAICVDGGTLVNEPWTKDYFPILELRWSPALVGFHGTGLAEELTPVQIEINKLLRQVQRGLEGAVPRIMLDAASKVTPASLNDEIWAGIKFTGKAPIFSPTAAFPPEVYNFLWQLVSKAYEISGVSEMSATGTKPAGLDSGAALREYSDINTERFVLAGQRWEAWFMSIARVMIDMTRDLAKRNPKLKIRVKDGKAINDLSWIKDVNLEEDQYLMQVFPVSGLPQTPAGRLQFVKELTAEGFVQSKEMALSLMDYPDMEEFISLQTAGLNNAKRCIQLILEKGIYNGPSKYMPLETGIQLAQAALLRGQDDGRPDERLTLLAQWIDEADKMLTEFAPKAPAAAPPMPPAGPPMDPMGAPPEGLPLAA